MEEWKRSDEIKVYLETCIKHLGVAADIKKRVENYQGLLDFVESLAPINAYYKIFTEKPEKGITFPMVGYTLVYNFTVDEKRHFSGMAHMGAFFILIMGELIRNNFIALVDLNLEQDKFWEIYEKVERGIFNMFAYPIKKYELHQFAIFDQREAFEEFLPYMIKAGEEDPEGEEYKTLRGQILDSLNQICYSQSHVNLMQTTLNDKVYPDSYRMNVLRGSELLQFMKPEVNTL